MRTSTEAKSGRAPVRVGAETVALGLLDGRMSRSGALALGRHHPGTGSPDPSARVLPTVPTRSAPALIPAGLVERTWSVEGMAPRRGGTSPVVVALLAGILLVLVVLVLVLLTQGGGHAGDASPSHGGGEAAVVGVPDGTVVSRDDLADPPSAPGPVGDPERIRASLPIGRTFESVLKVGIDARAEDKGWWRRELITVAYVAELKLERTVEENDGTRLVELRRFVAARNAKLLCDVEDARIDLGAPGSLLLGVLTYLRPEAGVVVTAARPIADAILRQGAQAHVEGEAARAVAHIDSLEGKVVRITYADGRGVESILPVGCNLSEQEKDFLFATAPMSDLHLLKDVRSRPGDEWAVEGSQLAGMLDPSLRGQPSGRIVVRREADFERGGTPYALLAIHGGAVELDASDQSTRRLGSFAPTGSMEFDLAGGFVEHATLTGRFRIEQASRDHLLFETHFRTEPTLQIDYRCTLR